MSLNANNNERVRQQRVQEIFKKIYNGEISNLECPYCLSSPLRFSYTFVAPERYGIWISCTTCGKEAHLRLKGERPPGYHEQYVLKEFQERDEKVLESVDDWWENVSREG